MIPQFLAIDFGYIVDWFRPKHVVTPSNHGTNIAFGILQDKVTFESWRFPLTMNILIRHLGKLAKFNRYGCQDQSRVHLALK